MASSSESSSVPAAKSRCSALEALRMGGLRRGGFLPVICCVFGAGVGLGALTVEVLAVVVRFRLRDFFALSLSMSSCASSSSDHSTLASTTSGM